MASTDPNSESDPARPSRRERLFGRSPGKDGSRKAKRPAPKPATGGAPDVRQPLSRKPEASPEDRGGRSSVLRERPDDGRSRAATGIAGSDLERRAATVLAAELESRGRAVQIQDVKIPSGPGPTLAIHALLVIAGSLIGLGSPLIGAAVTLLAAFSFYAERALGLPLISRLLPRRTTRNVISPPLGPAWETEVDAIFAAGYDAPGNYPTGAWLERRFGGRLTTDRILLWGGMIPTFVALMLRAAEVDGTWVQLLQAVAAALLLGVVAAQVDRRLAGEALGGKEDLAPARDLIAALEEAEREAGDGSSGVAICLFGAEGADAVGAEAFFADRRLKVKPGLAVIGLVRGADDRPEVTAREGDLSTAKMSVELAAESPLKPGRVIIRRQTAAGRARRRGARAVTVVGRGDAGIDVVMDAFDGALDAQPSPTPTRRSR